MPSNSLAVGAGTNQVTGSGFSYDANGNMTGDGSNTLTYDAANRLIASSNGTTSGGYVYDGNGIRVEKCVPNCTTGMSDEQATGIGETGQTCSLDGIEVDCGEFDTGGNGVGGDGFVQCQTATCGGFGQGRNGSSYIFYEDYVEGEGYADHTAFEYVGLTDAQVEALGLCDSCQWSGLGFSFSPQGSGGAGAGGGGGGIGGGGRSCGAQFKRFFGNFSIYQSMATTLNTNVDMIMAVSAYESGWLGQHAQDLHNLFGLTNAGGNNLSFSTYQASANYWTQHIGPSVQGTQTFDSFFGGLMGEGYNLRTQHTGTLFSTS